MELIKCIAGVIVARAIIVFGDESGMFEKIASSVSLADYDKCILKEQGARYRYIVENVLKGNADAQNVFDLAIAQMIYPQFGEFLRRRTGNCACVETGCKLSGYEEPSIDMMLPAYRLLTVLFETEEMPPFFKVEFFCDNRMLAFLEGRDKDFWPRGIKLYLAQDFPNEYRENEERIEEQLKNQLSGAIKDGADFCLITKAEGAEAYIVPACAAAAGKNIVFMQACFLEKSSWKKTAALLIREAVLYGAGIFIAGLNLKIISRLGTDGKSFIAAFREMAHKYHIPAGIGMDNEMSREINMERCRDMELFFVDRQERAENVSFRRRLYDVPYGTLEEPDPHMTLDSLVIPQHQKEIIERICGHVRHEKKVYGEWGMGEKYRYGRGTPVLFAGAPGTGKTMAAYVISNMLDIPLYKVDLSQVADKYIGETEKHLSRIFDCAQEGNVLLFFDEADSMFGKRSEVKEAKDRYANMEISYILQRIEEFGRIAILASNLRENIDTAFIRRMKYVIDFQSPDKAMREEIWRRGFSDGVPMGDIDFGFLARQFELAGGNIKNIILTASFIAAGCDEPVNMAHIFKAVENEYGKYSKKMMPEDFGEYGYLFYAQARTEEI